MSEQANDQPLRDLELLRAPQRDDLQRGALRARIMSRAELLLEARARSRSPWEVLAAWSRPGLVAAVVATILVAGALRSWHGEEPGAAPLAVDDMLSGAGQTDRIPAVLLASREPDADAVVAAVLLSNGRAPAPRGAERDTPDDVKREE